MELTPTPGEAAAVLAVVNPQFPSICTDANGDVVLWHGGRPREDIRSEILAVKDHLLAGATDLTEMRVEHQFVGGMYVRRLYIPAGTLLVGKFHRKDCVNVVEQGDISVLTEFGSRRLGAGFTAASPAGICKLGYAHADTVFVNIFRTDETDIDLVESEIASESFEALAIGGAP